MKILKNIFRKKGIEIKSPPNKKVLNSEKPQKLTKPKEREFFKLIIDEEVYQIEKIQESLKEFPALAKSVVSGMKKGIDGFSTLMLAIRFYDFNSALKLVQLGSEHLEFCKICTNRKFNTKQGLICQLTEKIADFEIECENFIKDEDEEEVVFIKKMAATGDHNSGDPMNFKKNKERGGILIVLGIGALLITLGMDSSPVIIIPFGPIIYGFIVFNKGTEQEKIYLKELDKKSKPKS